MSTYPYHTLEKQESKTEGLIAAISEADATRRFQRRGIFPSMVELTEESENRGHGEPKDDASRFIGQSAGSKK